MSATMGLGGGTPAPRFNLPVGQWIELDGKLLRFARRGRDRDRRLIFEGLDDVPADMTDAELLELQFGKERRLRLLSEADASDRLEQVGKPRMCIERSDEAANDETCRRHDYVRAWELAGCPSRVDNAVMREVVETAYEMRKAQGATPVEAKAPSVRGVLRWISDWVNSGGEIEALVPQWSNKGNTTDRLSPQARDMLTIAVEDNHLVDTRPTAVATHANVVVAFAEFNEFLPPDQQLIAPSLKAVRRVISRIDKYTLDCSRLGKREADLKWRPTGSSPQATSHNEVWEADHTRVNAIVVDEATGLPIGRPWVTCFIDRHTREIPGFHIGFDAAGTYPLMEALKVAISPKTELLASVGETGQWPCMGTPRVLMCDQGKEFKSKSFVLACLMLGIHVRYAPVLKAWYKGKIERFFRTLAAGVFHRVPGTTFANWFLRNKEAIPEQVAVVTLEELRRYVLHFIVNVYRRNNHRGLAMSPAAAWAESVRRNGMRPLPDPEKLTTALSIVGYRVPQHYGLEFEGLIYNSSDVAAYRIRPGAPRSVRVAVDSHDITVLRFLDPADNQWVAVPIKESMRARVTGVSRQKHKLARALQLANPERLSGDEGLAKAYTMIDRAMRDRRQAGRAGQQGPGCGLLGQADAAQAARRTGGVRHPGQRQGGDRRPVRRVCGPASRTHQRPESRSLGAAACRETDVAVPGAEAAVQPRRKRKPSGPKSEPSASGTPEVDDDIEAFAREMGMSIRNTFGRGRIMARQLRADSLSNLFIATTRAKFAFERFDQLMERSKEANYCQAMFVLGASGCGKTHILKEWVRLRRMAEPGFKALISEVPSNLTHINQMLEQLLDDLGDPDPSYGSPGERKRRIRQLATGHDVIFIDEVQRLVDANTGKVKKDVAAWFANFLNYEVCSLVLCGEKYADRILEGEDDNEYLDRRLLGPIPSNPTTGTTAPTGGNSVPS